MINQTLYIFYLFFLKAIKCPYKELRGFSESTTRNKKFSLEIKRKTFYWFECTTKLYLLYFDNSLEFHERSFLFIVVIPETTSKGWSDQINYCQLLLTAFDNASQTCSFFSFWPNEQNVKFYKFSAQNLDVAVEGELVVNNTSTFVNTDSVLTKISSCTSLLETVKIGTKFWNSFYKFEDTFFGLFIETYYILYQSTDERSKTVNMFRIADLIKVGYIWFQTSSVKGKVFLSSNEHSLEINFKQNIGVYERNKYTLQISFPFLSKISIVFDLEENKTQNFLFFLNNKKLCEYVLIPEIEKLPQVGKRFYLIENEWQEKLTIEVPVYYFGKKVEMSKLIFMFKLIKGEVGKFSKPHVFSEILNFNVEENYFSIYYERETYWIYFDYDAKDKHIFFKIIKVDSSTNNNLSLKVKETTRCYKLKKRNKVPLFLNGAIIYDKQAFIKITKFGLTKITLTNSEYSHMEFQIKSKNQIVCCLVVLIFLTVCLFIWLVYQSKKIKITNKKGRFNKMKKQK